MGMPACYTEADEKRLFEELISAFEELKEFYKKTCKKLLYYCKYIIGKTL